MQKRLDPTKLEAMSALKRRKATATRKSPAVPAKTTGTPTSNSATRRTSSRSTQGPVVAHKQNGRAGKSDKKQNNANFSSDDDDDLSSETTELSARYEESQEEEDIVVTEDETNWEVEKIEAKKTDAEGNVYYLLRWKNWDGEPSWEPDSNCGCDKLIQDYEEMIARVSREKHEKKLSPTNGKPTKASRLGKGLKQSPPPRNGGTSNNKAHIVPVLRHNSRPKRNSSS